jgi:PAS domain S-box-containing protein
VKEPPAAADGSANELTNLPATGKTSLVSFEGVAVLALGEAGEILAARDACFAVFGWDPSALVGQNIRVLLKDGLDNDVGRFLHRHRAGKNPAGTIALRVWGVRKDGKEFPAQVTTLTWNWGTAVTKKGDISRLCWTAAFRDLSAPAASTQQTPNEVSPAADAVPEEPRQATPEAVDQPSSAQPPSELLSKHPERAEQPAAGRGPELQPVQPPAGLASSDQPAVKAEPGVANAAAGNPQSQESDLQSQLAAATKAASDAAAALREEVERREKLEERLQTLSNSLRQEQAERSKRFEEELVGLRQERDELNVRLAAEQQGAAESTRLADELQARLSQNEAEFQRAKAELEKQTAARQQSESSWREQFDTVWIAKKEVEGAFAGAVERNKHVEGELAKLRREHDELKERLAAEQKSAADAKQRAHEVAGRLNRNAADSDRARAELEKENAERDRVDGEWPRQFDASKALQTKLQASLAEAADHHKRLEAEVTALRKERDELQKRVRAEQQMVEESDRRALELQRRKDQDSTELDRLAAELEKQTAECERAESRAREQQEAAKTLARKLEADWAAVVERNVQFEEELVELRLSRDELAAQLKAAQQASADAAHRADELEGRLERSAAELKRGSAEAERQRSEQERAEAEWREQLEAAKALARKLDGAWNGATERNRRLEEETAALRQEREDLQGRLAVARREAADYKTRADDLESQVRRLAAERALASGELKARQGGSECAGTDPRVRSEPEQPVVRRDLNHRNGHSPTKPDGSATARPSLPSMAAVCPIQRTTDAESGSAQTQPAASPREEQPIQEYSFDHPVRKPPRSEDSPSRRRSQP